MSRYDLIDIDGIHQKKHVTTADHLKRGLEAADIVCHMIQGGSGFALVAPGTLLHQYGAPPKKCLLFYLKMMGPKGKKTC